ncbi:N-acetyl-D-Glu racemase DgcA [Fodinicurvata halophila]|uniref:Dipeptide epimerase n=1 Tax=Fodinicurvata halophila TaxID=1419723 RepID=A0ABV8UHF8_9PROT
MSRSITLRTHTASWPIRGSFRISRGSKSAAEVVIAELFEEGVRGRGECVPYARYDESLESVTAQLESLVPAFEAGEITDNQEIRQALPAGAARNALDCAFWDLEAKKSGTTVWTLCGLEEPEAVTTAYTLSLDTADAMGHAASNNAARPLLKLKLAGEGDLERVRAVRANAPDSRLIVDANEGWTVEDYHALVDELAALQVFMIEQPFPAGEDASLRNLPRPVRICADESCHDTASLPELGGKYDMVNIKLDKTGGLTEALELRQKARAEGYEIMVGCMLASSLAMAPALLLAQGAEIVDLDGPLLLSQDCSPGLIFEGSRILPPSHALWG